MDRDVSLASVAIVVDEVGGLFAMTLVYCETLFSPASVGATWTPEPLIATQHGTIVVKSKLP